MNKKKRKAQIYIYILTATIIIPLALGALTKPAGVGLIYYINGKMFYSIYGLLFIIILGITLGLLGFQVYKINK